MFCQQTLTCLRFYISVVQVVAQGKREFHFFHVCLNTNGPAPGFLSIWCPKYLSRSSNLVMNNPSADHRFCLDCKSFLPVDMFKTGVRRMLCKEHFNKRMGMIKAQKWCANPQERQAKIVWQIAYIDSVKIFKQKINVTPAVVLELLQRFQIPLTESVRLVPVDPARSLSVQNCCLTSRTNRKDMCIVWKRLQEKQHYGKFLDPLTKRCIYAISHVDPALA